ncbi:MAG TPA: M23 family metallopeptidase [Clostridia bacterium]|nr:M23 family metallopeptidase [Clostridia bacterium]
MWNTKIFRQAIICLAAYGLVLAAIQGPSPISAPAARLLGRVVSEEYDFVAVMKRIPGADYIREKTLIPLPFLFKEEVKNTDPLKPGAMIWPLEGSITSSFGWRKDKATGNDEFHQGLDIEAPLGTPILAVMDGHVSSVNESVTYGNMVVLDHGDGLETVYAHCSEVLVKPPQLVKQGDVIARVGITGSARTPHLHFEVRRDGTPVDPRTFLVPSDGGDTRVKPPTDTSTPGTSGVVPENNMSVSEKPGIHGDAL